MTKTVAVPVELLRLMRNGLECICLHHDPSEYHGIADPCPVLAKIDAILSAPVVDEPAKYPIEGHVYTNKNFGPMKYLGIENCPDGSFMMFRSTEMRKEKYYTAAELPQWFDEFRA